MFIFRALQHFMQFIERGGSRLRGCLAVGLLAIFALFSQNVAFAASVHHKHKAAAHPTSAAAAIIPSASAAASSPASTTSSASFWDGFGVIHVIGLVVVAFCLYVLWAKWSTIRWNAPKWFAKHGETLTDYAISLLGAQIAGYLALPVSHPRWLSPLVCVGWGLAFAACLRSVRVSGWLPRRRYVEQLWAIPATPFLVVPVLVRNMLKSVHFVGLVALFVQLAAIVYYFEHPTWKQGLVFLAVAGVVGGGVVRFYCMTFKYLEDMGQKSMGRSILCAVLSQFLWPVAVIVVVLCQGFNGLLGSLFLLLRLIVFIILTGLFCSQAESVWIRAIPFVIGFVGLAPLWLSVLNLVVMLSLPSGYSGVDFSAADFAWESSRSDYHGGGGDFHSGSMFGGDGFAFNPANSAPMIGGMGGMDIYGNSFGSNFNDPFH